MTKRHEFGGGWGLYCCGFALLAVFVIRISAFAADPTAPSKTPVEWVAQLGSERLADRDAASAALLALGANARDAVHNALASKDPEIQSRARELWSKLHWCVIPGADAEITPLIPPPKPPKQISASDSIMPQISFGHGPDVSKDNEKAWVSFVKAHGAQTLFLLAEFHRAGSEPKSYRAGVEELLQTVPPDEVIKVIKEHPADSDAMLASIMDIRLEAYGSFNQEDSIVRILTAVGQYEKAFDLAHNYGADLASDCAVAVDRGGLFDKMEADAHKQIAAETDPSKLCPDLDFYAAVMAALHKNDHIEHLFDAQFATDPVSDNYGNTQRLTKTLMNAGLPQCVLKLLAHASGPLNLCMRSAAYLRANQPALADADWRGAQAAADAEKDAWDRQSDYADFADFMAGIGDPRTESAWKIVLTIPPGHSVHVSNALDWLCACCESKKDYTQAVVYYKKFIESSKQDGGYLTVKNATDGRYERIDSQEAYEQSELKRLEDLAAKQANSTPSPYPSAKP